MPVNEALESLLRNPRVWRARNTASAETLNRGWPSGYRKLDRHLPGGGWPRHAVTEILVGHHGMGELRLLMPALARLCKDAGDADGEAGWIAWIAPPFQPYSPALTEWGIDLSRLLVVQAKQSTDTLWAAEQALASGNCAAVLLWPDSCRPADSRRLQLAAGKGRSWAIVFRPLEARSEISAAALRLELRNGERGTDVFILKSRGGSRVTVQNVFHG